MRYIADLHLHSHFSIATSKDLDPPHLYESAARKGINLVGTGDFTHPGWRAELAVCLEPDGDTGLFRLKPELERQVRRSLPATAQSTLVRFVLTSEISSIYKKDGRARKVHNVVMMPTVRGAEALSSRLERVGNIRSDGRPILGLDCALLLEMCLESEPDCCFIPAHIWTPHFSVFGARSGFDRMEDCYGALTDHIYAVETGLSSDPPMNWRLSVLDRFTLVSNSDAHSPDKLGREANLIDDELSWAGLTGALRSHDPKRFLGTLEFYPEEGKYHYDGHRACGVRLGPEEARELGGRCPVCGGRLTGGVSGRVVELADRPEGCRPEAARPFEHLVPLREVLAEVLDAGPATKKINELLERVLSGLGPEFYVLREAPLEDISRLAGPLAAEALRRTRSGEVQIDPGYDGEFGTVRIFAPGERQTGAGQTFFFGDRDSELLTPAAKPTPPRPRRVRDSTAPPDPPEGPEPEMDKEPRPATRPLAGLNPAQREAVTALSGPLAVVAGPGTGKTRCLAARAWHLVSERGVPPERVAAVTFTNRAAREMRSRIEALPVPEGVATESMFVGTFHAWCLARLAGLEGRPPVVLDENERLELLREALGCGNQSGLREASEAISRARADLLTPERFSGPETLRASWSTYRDLCRRLGVLDFDDLIAETVRRLATDTAALEAARGDCAWLLVDEFQDVNPAQYALVRLLAGDTAGGLFVIGDPNQSIYAFRGAAPEIFERLRADYPDLRIITLGRGYRCGKSIAAASGALIAAGGSPWRAPSPVSDSGQPLRLMRCQSDTAEAIAVVREITRLAGGAGMLEAHGQGRAAPRGPASEADGEYSFCDFLVVARTAGLLTELERAFVVEGLPVRVRGSRAFLSDPGVQGLLAFLRLAANPSDNFHYRAALRLAGLDPADSYFSDLEQASAERGRPLLAALKSRLSREVPLSRAGERAAEFLVRLDRCRRALERSAPDTLLRELAAELLPDVPTDSGPLDTLLRVAARFETPREFIQRVALQAEGDLEHTAGRSRGAVEAVTLSTLHAAKGLEFPVVFICALEAGLLPFELRESDPAEERRLLYVGLTRASRRLYLSSAARRNLHGRTVESGWSTFLADIPSGLCLDFSPELPAHPRPDRQLELL